MIHLVYGEDVVSVDEALTDLAKSAGPDDLRDVNYTSLDADGLVPNTVAAAAFTVPFMSDRRVVVVKGLLSTFERRAPSRSRGASNNDPLKTWTEFADQLHSLPPTTELAFIDGGLSRSNPLMRKLAPISQVREFPLPRERDMPGWITRRANTIGVQIEPRAAATLAEAVGRQPRLIDSELRKLALYADGTPVGVEDVRQMVAYVREANIFQTVDAYVREANIFQAVDAIIDRRTGVALRMLRRIMEDGAPAAYVMTMIARQVRLAHGLSKDMKAGCCRMATRHESEGLPQDEIGRRLRLSGWVLNKTLQQERRLSFEYLAHVHSQLVESRLGWAAPCTMCLHDARPEDQAPRRSARPGNSGGGAKLYRVAVEKRGDVLARSLFRYFVDALVERGTVDVFVDDTERHALCRRDSRTPTAGPSRHSRPEYRRPVLGFPCGDCP